MACVARVSAAELRLAAAAACCAAAVAASDATFGADITPARPIGCAWATGIASTSASRLVPASRPPRDTRRAGRGSDRFFCAAPAMRETWRRLDRLRDMADFLTKMMRVRLRRLLSGWRGNTGGRRVQIGVGWWRIEPE